MSTENSKMLEEILAELDGLVGFDSVKEKIKKLVAIVNLNERRKQAGLVTAEPYYNLVLVGGAKEDRSMVAKLMGKFYRALGRLSVGEVIEVSREDLVSEYIGHTAVKTQEFIDKAKGNILLVNEPYTLTGFSGREALDTILAGIENFGNDFIVVLSGDIEPMQTFMESNPGLMTRFGVVPTDSFEDSMTAMVF